MLWQACASDSHPPGLPFAIVGADTILAWCRREEDAHTIAAAKEAAAEVADLAESGVEWIDEARRRRTRVLVARVADKLPEWKCVLADTHPDGFRWALVDGTDRMAFTKTLAVASFAVEVSTSMPELAAITRAAAIRDDEPWTKEDTAVVKTLALRLRRRLAELGT